MKKNLNGEMLTKRPKFLEMQSIALYIGIIVLLIAFTILCGFQGKAYLTWTNMSNIIVQSSIIAVAAIGASLIIITSGIDLSTGSIIGFSGMVAAIVLKSGAPLGIGVLVGIVAGTLLGVVNGFGISYGKLPPFIMTLAMMSIARGFILVMCGGKPVQNFSLSIGKLATFKIAGIPIFIFYVLVLYIVMIYVMSNTAFGRHIYALGGNMKAAHLSGINTKRLEVIVYILGAFFASVAGIMLLARLSYGAPTSGESYEMDCIAAAVIGGIALSGGKGRIFNTLLGALILGMLKNGLQMLNVQTYYQEIAIGLIIAVAVYFDKAKERKAE